MLILAIAATTATLCPTPHYKPKADYLEAQKRLTSSLQTLSNHPLSASEADQTLSKLLSAKSPVIFNWLRTRTKSDAPDEEDRLIREWRVYFAKNFVITQYPGSNRQRNTLIEQWVEKNYHAAFPPARKALLESAFTKAQAQSITTLQSFGIPADTLTPLITRVRAIRLEFLTTLSGSAFAKSPLEATTWGLAYDPVPNRINVGIETLRYADEATLIAVFAHEIGHAFDPCRYGAYFSGTNPFQSVLSCLRSAGSVAAKTRDDSGMPALLRSGKLSAELAESLRQNPTCNKAEYPPLGTQADQSLEAFADWFSAEVLSRQPAITIPFRTDLCPIAGENRELQPGSSYLPAETRLNRIYLANPKLAAAAGQKSEVTYCTSVR